VTKAPASFDCKKLSSFQDRHMQRLPIKQKVARMCDFLQAAKLLPTPPPCDVAPKLSRIIEAAGDRLKVAGDILAYADFFYIPSAELPYDEKDFEKRVKPAAQLALLEKYQAKLAAATDFTAGTLEEMTKAFLAEENIKIGDIIHTIRVAISGKGVGPGLYDCLELLGKEASLARIERAVAKAKA
jgi:glutamyl-tRNA synthetase